MKWLFNILDVWLHELVRVLKDEGVLVFFFVVPLLYPPLYAYLYNNEAVKEVPAVVVDNCKRTLSLEAQGLQPAHADAGLLVKSVFRISSLRSDNRNADL